MPKYGSYPLGTTPSGSEILLAKQSGATVGLTAQQIANLAPANFANVKSFGALGDERFITDAAITAGTAVLTSFTANFTTADNGRTIVINAGAATVLSGTYTSGATVTGATNSNVTLTGFNGGGTGTTAQLVLTGVDAIASGAALIITNAGTGYTSAPTTATIGNGIGANAATGSGTATISTVRGYAPIITTMTYVNATTVTLGTTATNTVSGVSAAIGTDDSTAIIAAVQAVYAAGGGTVYFPVGKYLMQSQLAIPNTGVGTVSQPPITLRGEGGYWDGGFSATRGKPASAIDLLYASGPKLKTNGMGELNITGMAFTNSGADTNQFIETTFTTLKVFNNSFSGAGPGLEASVTDAITLGNVSVGFQGYGTIISGNFFDKIRRGVYGGQFANAVVVRDNVWSASSGGNEAILLDGTVGGAEQNVIKGNLFELVHYRYAVNFTNSTSNTLIGNTYWDLGQTFSTTYILTGTSTGNAAFDSEPQAATDASSNGMTRIGKQIRSVDSVSIGLGNNQNPTSGQLWIVSTTNKIRLTYPSVVEMDAAVDISGYLNLTGANRYTWDNNLYASKAINIGTGGASAAFGQGVFTSKDANNGLLLSQPGVADVLLHNNASGVLAATGANGYTFDSSAKSLSATGGIGYGTGAGGTGTQATNKSTTVTLTPAAAVCGAITMNGAALAAATIVSFTLTNTAIAATDVLVLNHISGGTIGSYTLNAQCAAGSATINVRNNTAGSLSEAIVIQFALVKGVNA